jgi:hypothetical protein
MPVPFTLCPMQVPEALVFTVVSCPGSNATLPLVGGTVMVMEGAGRLSQLVPKPAITKTRARRPATTGFRRTPSLFSVSEGAGAGALAGPDEQPVRS